MAKEYSDSFFISKENFKKLQNCLRTVLKFFFALKKYIIIISNVIMK
ncbi:hypothetical protein FEM08_03890 [Flavobacterium gilvum]|nr:hypothetical protein FEM08_03890 [Flavobacterium gilvum]